MSFDRGQANSCAYLIATWQLPPLWTAVPPKFHENSCPATSVATGLSASSFALVAYFLAGKLEPSASSGEVIE